ncbi:type I restriction enzyme, R subunit [Marivirga sericea]|uniref:Type I restriction enzyme endonuclease subunit n=1 Tax=Marivirga sericea TaxID=1028 RepID=A0A1X7INU5_9BACT|nr:type I restriction endonuclease subunit R [Marivirga sericea]SMG16694.1 type I restriction enzyme, R subunit [Marivirga sericea]
MSTQPEAHLEQQFIETLSQLGYEKVSIQNGEALLSNLKVQLERFNKVSLSQKEFEQVLIHLEKGNVFEKAKTLRDRYALIREEETVYLQFFDSEQTSRNYFQVTHQITQEGTYKNRYDVTILVNGLPLVQTELKRKGLEMKEAFNQINRYQKHSFWSNYGLFQYVQLFIISNGINTKYLANNKLQSFKQTFYWADSQNRRITELMAFTKSLLTTEQLSRMIAHYIVMSEANKIMMVLRPYQFNAVEAIIERVENSTENGYIWHTTGSGKTLTSFKASQIIMDLPQVHKVVFVVDRKDLDYQTKKEFNSFKKGSVDVTNNTASLVKQFTDDTKLVLTTIQKLNNAITNQRHLKKMEALQDKRIVFIFDECHRSQFGETHHRIVKFFHKNQLFGFTGTPIFADNAAKNELGKRTTKDLFEKCLHKYVITDAIRDQNVLKFGIEYVGKYKKKGNTLLDIEVEDIDKQEVIESPERLSKITDYIIQYHDVKTHGRDYSAIFAVSSIESLIQYYELFEAKRTAGEHDLRVATIFSYAPNEEDSEATGQMPGDMPMAAEPELSYVSSHKRDKLEKFIQDYNQLYGSAFTTKDSKQFENYFEDISKRLKKREKTDFQDRDRLDILLVVNMFLTGFDAKMVNTLYVDKNLRYHGLIQAYSRTNRIINEVKSQGNILAFRNLKKATDEAITLFSNKEALEEITLPPYEDVLEQFSNAFADLLKAAPTVRSVDNLKSEVDEMAFVQAFRALMRVKNVLTSYTDFEWDDLPMDEQSFADYSSKYLDLKDKVKADSQSKEKVSILQDVDFELELIHRDEINVNYILKLLGQLKTSSKSEAARQKKQIMDMLGADVELRSKRELIEQFIEEQLPKIADAADIPDAFDQYWEDQKLKALNEICEEENLDRAQFKSLIETYIYNEQEPLRDEVFKCLDSRPSVLQARSIGERIIAKMKEFVQVFVEGMRA